MIRFYKQELLIERIADALVQVVQEALSRQASCTLVLSGGSTPCALYEYLAQTSYRKAADWAQVHFFWGDERYVPHDHPHSNYKMAYEVWLKYLAIPSSNIHPMPTELPKVDDAAYQYEEEVRRYVPVAEGEALPCFDLILLGMGEDGHTASLFPGDKAIEETKRWCVPASAPSEPKQRLTLTLSVLNAARHVWFLVTGASKASVLKRVLNPFTHEPLLPAARVKPVEGELVWWVDSVIDLAD